MHTVDNPEGEGAQIFANFICGKIWKGVHHFEGPVSSHFPPTHPCGHLKIMYAQQLKLQGSLDAYSSDSPTS